MALGDMQKLAPDGGEVAGLDFNQGVVVLNVDDEAVHLHFQLKVETRTP